MVRHLSCCAVVFVLAGCSKLVPVEGRVLQDGRPLGGAMVMFIPEGNAGEQPAGPTRLAQTVTDNAGNFRLNTHNQKGAIPGRYRVILSKKDYPPEYYTTDPEKDFYKVAALSQHGKQVVPSRYTKERDTPLRVEIPKKGTKDLKLEVTTKD